MINLKNVKKRDGSLEPFDINKILTAVEKAYKSCREKYTTEVNTQLLGYIETRLSEIYEECNIEDIQNIIEDFLMAINKRVAKAFILYRSEHSSMRDAESMAQFIDDYIGASNAATGSKFDPNANVEQKNICTLKGELSKKKFIDLTHYRMSQAIKKRYSKNVVKQFFKDIDNHLIYLHDATSLSPYCCSVSLYPFLKEGMKSLGGPSTAPTNLESFCGQFCNLIFAISSQFSGACLYKDQKLIIGDKNNIYSQSIKEFVDKFQLNKSFENFQGNWEYTDISNDNIYVAEDGKLVKVKKVYRRKYNDDIYKITTKNGCEAFVSKDHIFKTRFRGRDIEVKAKDLVEYDTVYTNKDYSYLVDKTSKDYIDGQFLGIICGDGSITDKYQFRIAINTEQMFIYDFVDKYVKENYNLNGYFVLDERKNAKCGTYQLSSKELVADVKSKMIYCDNYNTFSKNVNISKRSLSFQLGFLDGLLVTDGSFALNKGFTIALVNKGLIETVSKILNNLNIYKKTTIVPANSEKHKSEYYQINIPLKLIKYLNLTPQKPTNSSKLDINSRSFVHDINFYGREKYQISYLGQKYRTESINKNYGNIISICETNLPHLKDLHTTVVTNIEKFKNDDEYVYEIETETHWYNCGGLITHNCATPEFLMYINYFIEKEFGKDYINNLHKIVRYESKNRTIKDVIESKFQQVVHTINQPCAARDYQSVFWNIGYFDSYYFKSMFETFRFPDNTAPNWETLSWLQKDFMEWFNNERTKTVLTFPVETMALLTDGTGDYKDKEYADWTAKMYAEGHSFFTYISDSADSLSSCCFEGNEVIQVNRNNKNKYYITIKDFVDNNTFEINKYGEKLINSKNYIDSYNVLTNKIEKTLIIGVLKKEYSGQMYKFNVDNNIINVTADHLILVKNKLTNKIEEINAENIYKNKDNYLIAIK